MALGIVLSQVRRTPESADRFGALLASRWSMPFSWGEHDCCLWAADAVLALTGRDPARNLRGRYSTAEVAGRMVHMLGGMEAIATAALGEPMVNPMTSIVGDIGLTKSGALAVNVGEWWTAPGPRGLALLPLDAVVKAWKVGHA